MRRALLILAAASLLAATGCGQPSKGVNKGKDMPVSPPPAEKAKDVSDKQPKSE